MPSYLFPSFEADYDAGRVDLAAGPLRVMLVAVGYRPLPEHATRADVAGWEVTGLGYKAGGQLLNKRLVEGALLADDLLWLRCSVRAAGGIVYQADGDEPLIGYVALKDDLGQEMPRESVRGEFLIQWPGGRVLELR